MECIDVVCDNNVGLLIRAATDDGVSIRRSLRNDRSLIRGVK
jgi:hypothetical protein